MSERRVWVFHLSSKKHDPLDPEMSLYISVKAKESDEKCTEMVKEHLTDAFNKIWGVDDVQVMTDAEWWVIRLGGV
jgi:hypothetical protein